MEREQIEEILCLVKILEKKVDRVLSIQEENNRLSKEHQVNIQRILALVSKDSLPNTIESPSLLDITNLGFHSQVVREKNNQVKLLELLTNITADQFQELEESSVIILIPQLPKLLVGADRSAKNLRLGIAILLELVKNFPLAFLYSKISYLLDTFYSVVYELSSNTTERTILEQCGIEPQELKEMITFFESRMR